MGVLIALWLTHSYVERQPLLPNVPLRFLLVILTFSTVLATLVSADPTLTFPKFTNLFVAFAWCRLLAIITTQRLLPLLLVGFLAFSLLIAAMGVLTINWANKVAFVQAIINQLPNQFITLPGSSASGVSGNQLAGTFLLFWALPIVGVTNVRSQPLYVTLVAGGVAVGIGILLLATQSRSGWLGGITLCLAIPLLILLTTRSRLVRLLIALSLSVLVVWAIVLAAQLDQQMLIQFWTEPPRDTAIGNLGTITFRQEVWQWAIVAVGDFPFTGTGLGSFRAVVHRLYPIAVPVTYDIAHAHNQFLQVALDVGLIGLIAYLALLWNSGWMSIQLMRRQDPLQKVLGQSFIASMVGFHVFGLADALALGSKTHIIFWMFLGIVTGAFVNGHEVDVETSGILRQADTIAVSNNL